MTTVETWRQTCLGQEDLEPVCKDFVCDKAGTSEAESRGSSWNFYQVKQLDQVPIEVQGRVIVRGDGYEQVTLTELDCLAESHVYVHYLILPVQNDVIPG